MANKLYQMTPKEIVQELDKYIIGQDEAKKSVAIALRNRYRPVSYTHLDVYKRQLQASQKKEVILICRSLWGSCF